MRIRALALGIAVPLAIPAQAQFFPGPIYSGIRALQDRQLLTPPQQPNPTQPSPNPLPPVKREGDLPKEGPLGPEGGFFKLVHPVDDIDSNYPLIHAKGNIEFTDRGYHCWADELYGNQDTNVYTLKGNVRIVGQDESIYGDTVQVDFTNKTFVAEQSESTLKPALTQGLRDNLYVKGAREYGGEREIFGENTSLTTCSYPSPHFELIAEKTDVRPGKRVILRKVKIKILGHVFLKLAYLSIPLDERTYNNLPMVGKDPIAGYFIRTRYSSPLSSTSILNTRFDYFSKLGFGVGAGVQYDHPNMRGNISLYTIQGPSPEVEITVQHRQNFKWGTFSLDTSYEDNNYLYALGSKTLSNRAQLNIPQGKSSDRFTFYENNSSSVGSSSVQQTITANDTRVWTSQLKTTLDLNLSDNTSSFSGGDTVHREELDVNFRAVDDFQKAQARLDYVRSIPIGESQNFFTSSDMTPALTFLSDSRHLIGAKFDNKLPFQIQLGYGEYSVPNTFNNTTATQGQLTRMDFDFSFTNPRPKNTKHWSLTYQGEFKQDMYSDDTAQYILRGGSQLTYNFHDSSRFNISYNYLRPYGFSPLQIDRRGQNNDIVSDLSYTPIKNVMLGFATGYDFNLIKEHQPTPWQQVGIQALYTLGKTFQMRVISTYDTGEHAFSSDRFDLTWSGKTTYLSIGAKYDGERSEWAAANLFLDGLQLGRLRTSVLLNYNGYTKQFDAMHFSFIYDLHCAEAVLQFIDNPGGFDGGNAVYFFIRLKAFPFDTPFGTGTRGQLIGTGTGRD